MRYRRLVPFVLVALATLVALIATPTGANTKGGFKARLNGYQEVPSISTDATGTFRAHVNPAETEITFELTYSGLEGGAAAAAHIHLGQRGVAAGIVVHLCGTGGKPACPAGTTTEAMVTGTITASDVVALAGQGIDAGELDEVLEAMRRGFTYVNVHNSTYPTGEIRGQIRR